MEEKAVLQSLVSSLSANVGMVRSMARATSEGVAFRGEVRRVALDPGDPKAAGWTYLINTKNPLKKEIEAVLKPLAQHRGMPEPKQPLPFGDEPPEQWLDWLHDHYYALELEGKKVPHYILIVGGPDQVPFRFQSLIDSVANVGRVDFDKTEDLKSYVDKLIRLETAQDPAVERDVVVFAPDGGPSDPTYYSREYMAKPLADHITKEFGLPTRTVFGDDATKENLIKALRGKRPALVYTASHGLGATNESLDIQKRLNGAICCQCPGQLTLDDLFAGEDIPMEEPFLEGAIFFQFACFGYGTPAESDYTHWLQNVPEKYAQEDFVAALPKRLLAHPRGPIAYIGHLDTAFLHGFADPEEPQTLDRWHTRIEPFVAAINRLLRVQPSGLAMEDMNNRYSVCNAILTNTYDRQQRGTLKWTDELGRRFLDYWIIRSDAQNYMIFGDPAAHLRIPTT
jgi:hypothetical protein